jgi:hypothetical protein
MLGDAPALLNLALELANAGGGNGGRHRCGSDLRTGELVWTSRCRRLGTIRCAKQRAHLPIPLCSSASRYHDDFRAGGCSNCSAESEEGP